MEILSQCCVLENNLGCSHHGVIWDSGLFGLMGFVCLDRGGINSLWNLWKWKIEVTLKKFINLLFECYMLSSGSKCFFKQTRFFTNRNKKWRMPWLAWGKLQILFKVCIHCWGGKIIKRHLNPGEWCTVEISLLFKGALE